MIHVTMPLLLEHNIGLLFIYAVRHREYSAYFVFTQEVYNSLLFIIQTSETLTQIFYTHI